MLEKLSTREKVLIIFLALTASAFLLIKYFLGPQLSAYAALCDEVESARLQIARNLKEVNAMKREEEKLNEVISRYREIKPYFTTHMQDGAALVRLALEAQKEGVAITLFQPKPVVEKKYYTELPVEFGVRGEYRHVVNYLARVEDVKDMINLSEIRLLTVQPWSSGAGEEGDGREEENTGTVKAQFTLVIYAERTPEEKMKLEEMARWAVGRYNCFQEAGYEKPYPGVKPAGSILAAGSPASGPGYTAGEPGPGGKSAGGEANESLPGDIPYVMK